MIDLFSAPTVTYCEQAVEGLIARPGYALSNIPYILLGIYLIVKRKESRLNLPFGLLSILIGTASFIYDATYLLLTQIIDLSAMFIFILFLLGLNLKRLKSIQANVLFLSGFLAFVVMVLFTLFIGGSMGRLLFGIGVVSVLVTELLIRLRNHDYTDKYFYLAITVFIMGFGIWLIDANKIWCDQNNVFNGRSIFHYATTIAIFFLYRFYKQFDLN
jgi:hypothetical protein